MTLVVAGKADQHIFFVGDTKFSDMQFSLHERVGFETTQYVGGLKVIILSPGICVAFAGNVGFAQSAIEGIYDRSADLLDKTKLLNYFLAVHRKSLQTSESTDFLVATMCEVNGAPGQFDPEIFKIADSKVTVVPSIDHIGDPAAFNSYQQAFHTFAAPTRDPFFGAMPLGDSVLHNFHPMLLKAMEGMRHVINDSSISTVGGIGTVVITDNSQFKYLESATAVGKPKPTQPGVAGSPLHWGSAADGADNRHHLSVTGLGIFPIYSYTGQFGIIYNPERSFKPKIIHDITFDEFRREVELCCTVLHERALKWQTRVSHIDLGP